MIILPIETSFISASLIFYVDRELNKYCGKEYGEIVERSD